MAFLDLSVMTAWHWISFAVFLIIVEMLFGTHFFLLWMGIWAFVLSAIVWWFPQMPPLVQWTVFAITSSVTLSVVWFKLKHKKPVEQVLNKRMLRYIDREFTLVEAIDNGRGKIYVEDTEWRVRGPELPVGARVRVVGVEGTILRVEPL